MNRQLKLSVEQVLVAIEMLSPAEKRKIQRRLTDVLGTFEYTDLPEIESVPSSHAELKKTPVHSYHFLESRRLLREIQGALSADVLADREDRF